MRVHEGKRRDQTAPRHLQRCQVQGLKSGSFKDAGVKDGFIITEINDTPVNSTDDVEYIYNQVMKSGSDEHVLFLKGVYPTGKKYYYAVNLEQ